MYYYFVRLVQLCVYNYVYVSSDYCIVIFNGVIIFLQMLNFYFLIFCLVYNIIFFVDLLLYVKYMYYYIYCCVIYKMCICLFVNF